MTLLYINSWSIKDPLTTSTTIPNIEILSKSKLIKRIILVTPEYQEIKGNVIDIDKVEHFSISIETCNQPFLLKYICQEKKAKILLKILSKEYNFDRILARGSSAAGRALWIHKIIKKPFYIESFEPHAQVMKESGVWSFFDPRYLIQSNWERESIKKASGLMPVSHNYKKKLIELGKNENSIAMIPCTVDINNFKYDINKRNNIRKKLNIEKNAIVGIYVGKFGGIYYDKEAFEAFEEAFKTIDNFHLILLSPINTKELKERIDNFKQIDLKRVHHFFVPHSEIVDYLSASDFAYALIKSQPSTKYCSAIKIGEYWANGLPIIISKGVGDDSDIIKKINVGAIFDPKKKNYLECTNKIIEILKTTNYKSKIVNLAFKYRNPLLIKDGYKKLGFLE
jgi:hypothetical protein